MIGKSGVITSHAERRALVGDFYNQRCWQLFGGVKNGHVNHHGVDVVNYRYGRRMEAKGRHHRHKLLFPTEQLDRRLKEIDREFPHAWLVLFRYTMPGRKYGRRLYKVARTGRQLSRYLVEHTSACYIVDLHIIDALRHHEAPGTTIENGKRVNAVSMSYELLGRLTGDAWQGELACLGLNPRDFRVQHRPVSRSTAGTRMRFMLAAITLKTPRSFRPLPVLFHRERKATIQIK
jgi:hypothetical protein